MNIPVERLWYHHKYITLILFIEHDSERVQFSIGEPTLIESVELHQLRCSERKRQASIPLVAKHPAITAPKKKKKKMLNKLADVTPPLLSVIEAAQPPDASATLVTVPPSCSLLPHLVVGV